MAAYKLLKDRRGVTHLVEKDQADAWLAKHGQKPKECKKSMVLPKTVERGSWVWDGEKVIPRSQFHGRKKGSGLQVIKDIEPFQNVAVDGKMIGGRRQKRDMMRAHGLVEVGNEYGGLKKDAPETYRQQADRVGDIKQAFRQHGVDIL